MKLIDDTKVPMKSGKQKKNMLSRQIIQLNCIYWF